MSSWLEAASPIFHPDTPTAVLSAVSNASRLHSRSESELGSETRRTSSENKAKEWLGEKVAGLPKGQYHLTFGRGVDHTFDGKPVWAPRHPVFLALPQAIVENLRVILEAADDFVVVVRRDGGPGIVVDSYAGYLPEEPNPDEVVYELTAWNNDA